MDRYIAFHWIQMLDKDIPDIQCFNVNVCKLKLHPNLNSDIGTSCSALDNQKEQHRSTIF